MRLRKILARLVEARASIEEVVKTKVPGKSAVKQAKERFKALQKSGRGSSSGDLLPAPVDKGTAVKAMKTITGKMPKSEKPGSGKHNPFKYAKDPAVIGPGPDGKRHYKAYAFPWKCVCLAGSSACKKGR